MVTAERTINGTCSNMQPVALAVGDEKSQSSSTAHDNANARWNKPAGIADAVHDQSHATMLVTSILPTPFNHAHCMAVAVTCTILAACDGCLHTWLKIAPLSLLNQPPGALRAAKLLQYSRAC